uniref:Cilia and flagella associated protein 20 n=1 Tax=Myotis myotis TaxID=51298 RepID=A0A7J7SAL3_MYOMY|nr:cilia and flagella associated protein 20 [Myotis myotis]
MPMRLDDGWNQIQFNLSDFTRRAYGTNYIETLRVQIHANCRIRRVYFSDRLYSEDELPAEFKLYLPVQNKGKVSSQDPRGSQAVGREAVSWKVLALVGCTASLHWRGEWGAFPS